MSIGQRIAAARAAKNLSQTDLARIAGVTPSAINQIESGLTKSPKIELVFALADALDVDARTLTFGERKSRAAKDVSREILKLADALPPAPRAEVLDFALYKIERTPGYLAREQAQIYRNTLDQDRAEGKKPD